MPGDFDLYMSKANFDALSKPYSVKSFKSIPVYVTDAPKEAPVFYNIFRGRNWNLGVNYTSEASAIEAAERKAKDDPGTEYFVMKAITKSYVAPTPSITTRL